MNIIYLLTILETNKISELVENIDLPPIDINLALWEAEKAKEVKIDAKKDKIETLKVAVPSCDEDLADKLFKVIRHYASEEKNITRGTMNGIVKTPDNIGYGWHEYLMALQWLIDTKKVLEYEISVPEIKNQRPYHKFVFLCLPGNPNEEWNAREVNKWIANWETKKVK